MSAQNPDNNSMKTMEGEEKKEIQIVEVPDDFDLENFIGNYIGHTKIQRLLFIAEHCPKLSKEAYRLAMGEIKKTTNTSLYKTVCEKAVSLGPENTLDIGWIESVDKKSAQSQERLEIELNNARTSVNKEKIRQGHNQLGDFHYARGDPNSALKCYVRARDYCTSPNHIVEMCMNVIKVGIDMGNYPHVVNYVAKAEQVTELQDKQVIARLKVCAGLANLENRKYKMAARKFLETTADIGDFSEVIASHDIAIYGGLCALASFDRQELKKKVIDNISFSSFLEQAHEVRELINDFYSSNYASCLKYLDRLKPNLLLDIHLHQHVNEVYKLIRNKALIQYFSPFSSIDLTIMAEAFNTTVSGLEKELSQLIIEGLISARIDSHNKRLYARQTDQRSATFERTLSIGEEYQENTKAALLRVHLYNSDFLLKTPRREEKEKKPSNPANFPAVFNSFFKGM